MHGLIKEYFRRNPRMAARGYQLDTIGESLSLFTEKDYHALLIESPTGSGKTVMGIITAAMLAEQMGLGRIGWVAMRRNLLSQAMDVAQSFGLGHLFHPISMFEKNPVKVDILVVDEAHHDATVSMATLHKKVKPVKVLGLSATPTRADKAELIFEKTVAKAGIYELVRLGYLARPDQFILPDWNVQTVVDCYLSERQRWGKSILFFHTMEECQEALARLRHSGVPSEIVHAGSDRETILRDFEAGRITTLINMAILTEGFDSPDLETVFVRPSNRQLTQQMAGRVLRISQGMRKKIVQSQDSIAPFSSLAPIGRSFKRKPDGSWMALDYDAEEISRLISASNKKLSEHLSLISEETHQVLSFLNAEKDARPPQQQRGGMTGRPFQFPVRSRDR